MNLNQWVGIDYGAKLAGTSVVCLNSETGFRFFISPPKKDADEFIHQVVAQIKPKRIFLDAPLGLPIRYQTKTKNETDSYFYRKCDEETGAMSPLFLGGLTARAIQLKDRLENQNIAVFETYPGYLARLIELGTFHYKKELSNIASCYHAMDSEYPKPELDQLINWHVFDSWLAWLSGWRYAQNIHLTFGESAEGLIIV